MSAPAPNLLIDDTTGDLYLSNGNLVINSGYDAVRQAVYSRLRFFAGEWFADENIGIPYWNDILGKKQPNLPAIREIFRQAILKTPGIASITSIDLRQTTTRGYTLTFSAKMDDGSLLVTDGLAIGAP